MLTTIEEIKSWFEWAAKSPFNPIVIDTIDGMYQTVSDSVCVRLGIENPTKAPHGIAWFDIYDDMREQLAVLSGAGKGVIMLSHITYQEKVLRGGAVIQAASFNVSGKTKPFLAGMADQILHFDTAEGKEGVERIIRCTATAGVEAGDRWNMLPEEISRGNSPLDAATSLLKCFYDTEK